MILLVSFGLCVLLDGGMVHIMTVTLKLRMFWLFAGEELRGLFCLTRMGKGSKSSALFKDKAKNRVDDLQGMFINLQSARKESRTYDAGVLEEQVHQMLREWKAELNEPSPASSLQARTNPMPL